MIRINKEIISLINNIDAVILALIEFNKKKIDCHLCGRAVIREIKLIVIRIMSAHNIKTPGLYALYLYK